MRKVLVIDDDAGIADLLTDVCQDNGFDARSLTDARKAVELAKSWKPDMITLDIEMPDIDGIDVLNRLKADPATRHIPVLVVSILAKEAEFEGALRGAHAVLQKPIRFDQFLGTLAQMAPPTPSVD